MKICRVSPCNSQYEHYEIRDVDVAKQIVSGKISLNQKSFVPFKVSDRCDSDALQVKSDSDCQKSQSLSYCSSRPQVDVMRELITVGLATMVGGSVSWLKKKSGNEKSSVLKGSMIGAAVGASLVALEFFAESQCIKANCGGGQ